MKFYYVYILLCSDDTYYTGVTNNLDRRIREHTEGINSSCYTYYRRPVTIMYIAEFTNIIQAIAWEKQIKGWSRKKKQALINENWEELKFLSICRNNTSHENL